MLANRDGIGVLKNFIYGDTPEKSAVGELVRMIRQSPWATGEVRLYQLCFQLNIRPLSAFDFGEITSELFQTADLDPTRSTVTRFLCSISFPVAARLGLYRLADFGVLGDYPYREVVEWVDGQNRL